MSLRRRSTSTAATSSTTSNVLALIEEAAEAGCDLVVFPELSVTGHNGSPR